MLATRGDHVPTGDEWVHEVKWDGIRALVEVADGVVRVWSRSGRDLSVAFPELAELAAVVDDLLLDGEIVALGDGDVPSLGGLAERIHITDARKARRLADLRPVTLLAFDVLRYDGRDLDRQPWSERRAVLDGLGLDDVSWQVPATYDDGPSLLCRRRGAGARGHRVQAGHGALPLGRAQPGLAEVPDPADRVVRGRWLPARDRQRPPARCGAGRAADAPRAGVPRPRRQRDRRQGRPCAGRPAGAAGAGDDPFLDVPRIDAAGTVWVEPVLVVDVQYLRITTDGRLRQPSYRGVRTDLAAGDRSATCEDGRMPDEVHVEVDGRTLKLSNLDKVLYPQTGTTKGEVLNYYAQVAPVLLPHVADRAVTRIRWPNGTAQAVVLREERTRRRSVVAADREGADHRLARLVTQRATSCTSRSSTGWPRSPTWSTSRRWSSTCTSGRSGGTAGRRTPTGW